MLEKMWSKGNTLPLLVGMHTCTTTLEINMVVFFEKLGINLPQDPTISLLGIYPKDAQSYYKDICSTMFVTALFVKARTWKQAICPSTEEWIKKMWHIYILEHYSAVKTSDTLKFACKWMGLKKSILCEVSQT